MAISIGVLTILYISMVTIDETGLAEVFARPGDAPLMRDPTNAGRILAPSQNHAVAAAVLRNGYLSNATPDDPEVLAINLSSERVRVALGLIDEAAPDLILLDLMMTVIDGFEFLEALRHRPDRRIAPVVVVTAADLSEEDHRRLNGGVEYVLQKSGLNRDQLLAEIRELVTDHVTTEGADGGARD